MTEDRSGPEGPRLNGIVFFHLLDEARDVSDRILGQLRALRNQFPSALLGDLIEQVERIRTDPAHERRRTPRQREADVPASVAEAVDFADWQIARLIDHSPGGAALQLDRPMKRGAVLLVWLGSISGDEAWIPLSVRHCRQEGERWIVGGEFVGEAIPRRAPAPAAEHRQ